MQHCGIHVFLTSISPSDLFFLGKPAWTLGSDSWIQNFTTQRLKFRIQPSDSQSHQSLHGATCFVAFANRIRSRTCGITLVRLHVFHFYSDGTPRIAIYEISTWNRIYVVNRTTEGHGPILSPGDLGGLWPLHNVYTQHRRRTCRTDG